MIPIGAALDGAPRCRAIGCRPARCQRSATASGPWRRSFSRSHRNATV